MTCKPHDHQRCLELFGKLSEYIDREMDETERRDFEAHVAECLACLSCLPAEALAKEGAESKGRRSPSGVT